MIEFKVIDGLTDYEEAVRLMQDRVAGIIAGNADESVVFLEHPPIYTAGTGADIKDLLDKNIKPYRSERGGQYTYHGPGQLICYLMMDLKKRNAQDVRKYVYFLEQIIIEALKLYNINGLRRAGRVGIWVEIDNKDYKIAAIGVRLKKWVTYHGFAINLNPDLEAFNAIVPCGIKEHGVTSCKKLGINIDKNIFIGQLKRIIKNLI